MALNANSTQAEKNAHYRNVLQTYARLVSADDVEGICALYADDAVIDDPVGGPQGLLVGAAAVRGFYTAVAQMHVKIKVLGPISGSKCNVAIAPFLVTARGSDINCMSRATFNDEGKIIRYDAHWGAGDFTGDKDPSDGGVG